jgi:hypothetical protein
MTDSEYYSALNSLRQITTMARIGIDVSKEIQEYMAANITKKPKGTYTDGSGKEKVNVISDGGKESITRLIMDVLKPKVADPNAELSQATISNPDVDLTAAPNTGAWAQDILQDMPQGSGVAINLPRFGQTTITRDMKADQREAAVKANNPDVVIITPNMSEEDQRSAKRNALAAQNQNRGSSAPLTNAQFEPIATSVMSRKGFSSPNTSYAVGGQGQWYMVTVPVASGQASAKCAEYNGRLATRQQIQDAQTNGASYTTHGTCAKTSLLALY